MMKHVGDTTYWCCEIAPSDVAGSMALHSLESVFCDLCVWIPNAGGILEGWPDYGLVCTSFDYFRRAVDIAFDETECFVHFRSDCGYVFIPA